MRFLLKYTRPLGWVGLKDNGMFPLSVAALGTDVTPKLFFQMAVHVNSLLAQTEGRRMVVLLKENWEKRRIHGETSKSNWFL